MQTNKYESKYQFIPKKKKKKKKHFDENLKFRARRLERIVRNAHVTRKRWRCEEVSRSPWGLLPLPRCLSPHH